MTTVTITMSLPDEDFATGWDSDADELEGSVRATLHEVIGADGPYVLSITSVDVTGEV